MSDQIQKIRKVIENIKRNKIESIKLQKKYHIVSSKNKVYYAY